MNIDTLITTYSGLIESLKEIRKKEEELKTLDNTKLELKRSKDEIKRLLEIIKWNEKHIKILSRTLGEKICPDCGGEGGFEGYEGEGGPCETCKTFGLLPINQ